MSKKDKKQSDSKIFIVVPFLFLAIPFLFLMVLYFLDERASDDPRDSVSFENVPESQKGAIERANSQSSEADDALSVELQDEKVEQLEYSTPRQWDAASFANSLSGTDIDGELRANSEGDLIIEREIKDFFDYMFSAASEVGGNNVIDEIKRISQSNLPDKAHEQAMEVLEDYLVYKQQVSNIRSQPVSISGDEAQKMQQHRKVLSSTLTQMKDAQKQALGEDVAKAFFKEENKYAESALRRMDVQSDESLSDVEKQQKIREERKQTMSGEQWASFKEKEKYEGQSSKIRHLMNRSKDSNELAQALSEASIEDDRKKRIAQRYQQREAFNKKFEGLEETFASYEESGLAKEDKKAQIDEIIEQNFDDESERVRARFRLLHQ